MVPGGFVGVDVFFVISGFLISSLILNGLKDGSFGFLEFYGRRARRLFPALVVVLLVTWCLGWFTLSPAEYAALGRHTLAAAAFAANFLTYSEVGYFDVPAATKPLLHLWSLGVEEQFYLVYPALLLLFWRHRVVRSSLILIAIVSFALNVGLVRNHPSFTFYLPLTRFWEFIAGGLLACGDLQSRTFRLATPSALLVLPWRDVSATTGLLLILAGLSFTSGDANFPGWWALLPVLGTFFIISAGPKAWFNRIILANPILAYIGLISYPLYLWHWPLLVIGRDIMRHNNAANEYPRTTTIVAVALAFVLSWVTYQFIERPVRARRPQVVARWVAVASAGCLVCVALLGFATAQSGGLLYRYPSDLRALFTPLTDDTVLSRPNEAKNSAGPLLVAFGDSHAQHLMAGLSRLQNERTFRLQIINWGYCPPWGEVKSGSPEKCRGRPAEYLKEITQLKPDIIVLGAFWWQYEHLEKIRETLRLLKQIGVRRIVVIGTVPFWPEPPQQLLYKRYMENPLHQIPVHRIPLRLTDFNKETIAVDRRLQEITSTLGVHYISAYNTLCDQSGCLVRLGDTAKEIVQFDLTHFSAIGSWFFVSHIADEIFN